VSRRPPGVLRIIGGDWRSRRVHFDAASGVRPTPDRVRQTVFDWLAPLIHGSTCLDLFAGSGALGLEALSRGAAHVSFVESAAAQASAIRQALTILQATDRAEVIHSDGLNFLSGSRSGLFPQSPVPSPQSRASSPSVSRLPSPVSRDYDVVFLDPPFGSELLLSALQALPTRLAATHRIYVEWPAQSVPIWPPGFELLRVKRAGQVSYGLGVFVPAGRENCAEQGSAPA
jgi:16S rRNA (guanine966-N2)-methyltransferase